jgi:hypothetical protein
MTQQNESLQVEVLEELTSAVKYRKWLLSKCYKEVGERPFELGSGSGIYAQELLNHSQGIQNLAVSEVSEISLERLKVKFTNSHSVSVIDLRRDYAPADLHTSYISWNVLEHIEDDVAALARANVICEDNSFVFALVPAFPSLMSTFDKKIGHHRRYTKNTLRTTATEAGLKNVRVEYLNFVGWFGWLLLMKLGGGNPRDGLLLKIFDTYFVPILAKAESLVKIPFGQSAVLTARTNGVSK